MMVSGDDAKKYDVIRRDTMKTVNQGGTLIFADDVIGTAKWKDDRGEGKELTDLGPNAIYIDLRRR